MSTRNRTTRTHRSGAGVRSSAAAASTSTGTSTTAPLSDDQNKQLIQYALGFVGMIMILRILTQAMYAISLLLIPLLYLYALQTCPSEQSFDAKRELKRILRGANLPDTHKDKPRGWLNETLARVNATLTTELATLPGYEVMMMSVAGVSWWTTVRVPTVKTDFFWIGAFDRWTFVYSKEWENQE